MPTAEATIQITTESLLSATCGRETLLVRYDGQARASVAIDEHDNGTIVSVSGGVEFLEALCKALQRPAVKEPNEERATNLGHGSEGLATLVEGADGYELTLDTLGERPRRVCFSRADGQLLRKAIRGTFALWD